MSVAVPSAAGTGLRGWIVALALLAASAVCIFIIDSPIRRWLVELPIGTYLKQLTPQSGPGQPHRDAGVELADDAKVVAFGLVDIEGGEVRLSTPVAGIVEELTVSEGDIVAGGQQLLKLRTTTADQKLVVANETLKQAKLRLQVAHRAPKIYLEKIKELESEVSAGSQGVSAQRDEVNRLRNLPSDIMPESRLELEERKLSIAESKLSAFRSQLEQARIRDPSDEIDLARSDVAKAQAMVAEAEEFLRQHTLVASEPGIVLRVLTSKGQVLANPVQPALLFRPKRKSILRCEVNQEFADRVVLGMRAEIYMDRLDGKKWFGKVTRIADWIAPRRSQLDEPFERNDVRTLEVIVAFDDAEPGLRQGQRMRVVFAGDG